MYRFQNDKGTLSHKKTATVITVLELQSVLQYNVLSLKHFSTVNLRNILGVEKIIKFVLLSRVPQIQGALHNRSVRIQSLLQIKKKWAHLYIAAKATPKAHCIIPETQTLTCSNICPLCTLKLMEHFVVIVPPFIHKGDKTL